MCGPVSSSSGSLVPAMASALSAPPSRSSRVHRPPRLRHLGFILSCALPPLQSISSRNPPSSVALHSHERWRAVAGQPPLGFPSPSRRQPEESTCASVPGPHVPPSAFLTPSTASSSPGLAGLFRPAATSGIRSPGVFPPPKPCELVARRCPPDLGPLPLPWSHTAPGVLAGLQGFAPRSESGPRVVGVFPTGPARSPPELSLPRVLLRESGWVRPFSLAHHRPQPCSRWLSASCRLTT